MKPLNLTGSNPVRFFHFQIFGCQIQKQVRIESTKPEAKSEGRKLYRKLSCISNQGFNILNSREQ